MVHLTLAGMSEDGARLLLVNDAGDEFTLTIDHVLRAALRGERSALGQLEIQMQSALRPRDIQARIRAGETPESVAGLAQTTLEKIMPFAAPVLAERAHVAERARASSLRHPRGASTQGPRTLDDAVNESLRSRNVDPGTTEWDAWRREDGRWTVQAQFAAGSRTGTAHFSFDMPGNYVLADDDDARWLVGDEPDPAPAAPALTPAATVATAPEPQDPIEPTGDDLARARRRRLSAVPAEQLPLGGEGPAASTPGKRAKRVEPDTAPAASPDTESTADLTKDLRELQSLTSDTPVEAWLDEAPTAVHPAIRDDHDLAPIDGAAAVAEPTSDPASEQTSGPVVEPAAKADEAPSRRQVRKRGGRASVPSWDEIMFGGGPAE